MSWVNSNKGSFALILTKHVSDDFFVFETCHLPQGSLNIFILNVVLAKIIYLLMQSLRHSLLKVITGAISHRCSLHLKYSSKIKSWSILNRVEKILEFGAHIFTSIVVTLHPIFGLVCRFFSAIILFNAHKVKSISNQLALYWMINSRLTSKWWR